MMEDGAATLPAWASVLITLAVFGIMALTAVVMWRIAWRALVRLLGREGRTPAAPEPEEAASRESVTVDLIATARDASGWSAAVREAKEDGDWHADDYHLEDWDSFPFPIVGESNYQPALHTLLQMHGRTPFRVVLFAEPDNPYDANAVQVSDLARRTLGYLSRVDAAAHAPAIYALAKRGMPVSCYARLFGGEREKPAIGVWLDLDPTQIQSDS